MEKRKLFQKREQTNDDDDKNETAVRFLYGYLWRADLCRDEKLLDKSGCISNYNLR